MKRLYRHAAIIWLSISLTLFILLAAINVYPFELEAKIGRVNYQDAKWVEAMNSYTIKAGHKGFYVYGSQDGLKKYGGEWNINSIGIGYEATILKYFKPYAQVGYYMPQGSNYYQTDLVSYRLCEIQGKPWESQGVADHYMVYIDPGMGGEIGLGVKSPPWKGLSVSGSIGYRFLNLYERIQSRSASGDLGSLANQSVFWGGSVVSVGLEYRF